MSSYGVAEDSKSGKSHRPLGTLHRPNSGSTRNDDGRPIAQQARQATNGAQADSEAVLAKIDAPGAILTPLGLLPNRGVSFVCMSTHEHERDRRDAFYALPSWTPRASSKKLTRPLLAQMGLSPRLAAWSGRLGVRSEPGGPVLAKQPAT